MTYAVLPRLSENLRTKVFVAPQAFVIRRDPLASQRSFSLAFLSAPQYFITHIAFPALEEYVLCFSFFTSGDEVILIISIFIFLVVLWLARKGIVMIGCDIRRFFGQTVPLVFNRRGRGMFVEGLVPVVKYRWFLCFKSFVVHILTIINKLTSIKILI